MDKFYNKIKTHPSLNQDHDPPENAWKKFDSFRKNRDKPRHVGHEAGLKTLSKIIEHVYKYRIFHFSIKAMQGCQTSINKDLRLISSKCC